MGDARHWGDRVAAGVGRFGPLVIGIDPDPALAPDFLVADPDRFLLDHVRLLLDCAAGRAGFVKFQSAYFEAFGSRGIAALARSIAEARERGFAVILDAKRGDIGSTAEAYARAYLTPRAAGGSDLEVDCMTVNPLLGPDTIEPFVDRARSHGKGVLVLVKTSNPGSGWLQDQAIDGETLSERVAALVDRWAGQSIGDKGIGAVGAVLGATWPAEAGALRRLMPRSVILAPGLGSQGGDGAALAALATATSPILVSASRGIAATDRADLSPDDYAAMVSGRIAAFGDALAAPA
jgi:orotidine-5'-phosphate decarboxylase